MRPNALLEKLRNNETAIGLTLMYPAPGIVEGMCGGYDFVWIDGQHGEMSYDSALLASIAARGMNMPTVIRVPTHDQGLLGKWADLSPSAIMVPMVNNVDQAGSVVEGLRFPPLGTRSYGGRRVIDLDGREFFRETELIVISQVETLEAVENAPQIIATEGIDMLFYGPDDMRCQLGLPMDTGIFAHPKLKDGFIRTAKVARDAGKLAGTVAGNADALKQCVEAGYQLIVVGGDIKFLRVSAAQTLTESRAVIQGVKPVAAKAKTDSIYGG